MTKPTQTALLRIIKSRLRRDAGLCKDAPLSENGFFDDAADPPSQFFIARENPYEIAPYVRGYVEVSVPYEAIQDALTDYGKALLRQYAVANRIFGERFGGALNQALRVWKGIRVEIHTFFPQLLTVLTGA
ncbi:MAG: RsiV family protein [Treponema sp.]|nr:RsiV family protein [Treponema sp.]